MNLESMKKDGAGEAGTDAAFFLPDLTGGGTEKIMTGLANEFAERGLRVDFVLVMARGVNFKFLSDKIRVVDLNARNTYLCLPGLVRYFRGSRPRVFLSSLDLTNLMALIARRLSGVNTRLAIRIDIMVSVQRRPYLKKKLEKILLSLMYPRADEILAISKNVAEDIIEYAGTPPVRTHVIHNPVITPELVEKAREEAGHPWLKAGGPPVILGAGRLTEQKDFATLLQAFAILRGRMPAKLIILGEGEQRPELEAAARRLNIDRDVDLHGYVENPYSFMRQSSAFVLSSKWEGSPAVLIGALACGCPAVSTDCPGAVREILDDGAYGDLVPMGDAAALAEAIRRVLVNGGKKVDAKWRQQYTLENVTEETLKVLGLA